MGRKAGKKNCFRGFAMATALAASLMTLIERNASANATSEPMVGTGGSEAEQGADNLRRDNIEGALLSHQFIDPLKVKIEVNEHIAILQGNVETHVQRDLAREIALSIDGIDRVNNRLQVSPDSTALTPSQDEGMTKVGRPLSDNALTARVKTRLLANINVPGAHIEVVTHEGEVTLSGIVESVDEQQLAYYLASNTDEIVAVRNDIQVNASR